MRLFLQYATRIGLNTDSLRSCVTAQAPLAARSRPRSARGSGSGWEGTPTFFVNGHKLPDTSIPAFDDLTHMVDSITAATAAAPAAPGRGKR